MKVIWSWLTNEQVFIISMYCLTTFAEVWYCLAVFHLLKLHSMFLKASTFLKGRAEGQVGWSVALFAYMHAYIMIDGCMRGDKGNFHDLWVFCFFFFTLLQVVLPTIFEQMVWKESTICMHVTSIISTTGSLDTQTTNIVVHCKNRWGRFF